MPDNQKSTASPLKSDLVVIGAGMAGMASALFAANRGLSTICVGITSQTVFSSGLLDLMGIYPCEEGTQWTDPWEGIHTLAGEMPLHPYARMKKEMIQAAFEEVFSFLALGGLPYRHHPNRNSKIITPVGTVKTTYGVPRTMWNGVLALEEKRPSLILDFHGLRGFSARQIAATLQASWPDLRTQRIDFPAPNPVGEVYPEQMARSLEVPQNLHKLAGAILPHIKRAGAVGLPAVLGMYRSNEKMALLEKIIGVPVFEIPTMPPSIAGLRIKETFEEGLMNRGVTTFFQKKVLRANAERSGDLILGVGNSHVETTIQTKSAILATGRFLGQGLSADRKGIRETLFDLPVHQPAERGQWHRDGFLDRRGHPINQSGVEIDDSFRPVSPEGSPLFPRLFAAGSILAHHDWMRTKCGSGLSLATAYAAVTALKNVLSNSERGENSNPLSIP